MNIDAIVQKLPVKLQQQFKSAVDVENFTQACALLHQAGLNDEAINLAQEHGKIDDAIDLAIKAGFLDKAEFIAKKANNILKLADILMLRERFDEAAELYTQSHQYEKAAKLYFKLQQYDKAAVLYADNQRYMDAIMCYQKSGNTEKQLEMQILAFENDLALANGELPLTSVSRTMAIYAAKVYLSKPDKFEAGISVLKKANALLDTAAEMEREGQYEMAAKCYEAADKMAEARESFIMAEDLSNALRICTKIQDDELEIDTLKRFQKFFRLGQKFIALKRFDEAIQALKSVEPDDSSYPSAMELQGDIYCKQKNFGDAALCYESLFWLNLPSDRICRVAYKAGYSYETMEDYNNALANYQRGYEIDPNFHDITATIQAVSDKLKQKELHESSSQVENTDNYMRRSLPISSIDPMSSRNSLSGRNGQSMHSPIRSRGRISTIMIGQTEVAAIGDERYNVVEEIAHGGMGVVYKATDTILMRTVALKVLSNKLRDNPVALEYFMREARASAQLQHINIVTVYDIGSLNDGTIYMAMEFIDGKNLKQLVTQTGPFPTKSLVQIMMHACRGLQYAHDNGIIHRDVKSSNMMIAKKDKMLKICDLGLAKFTSDDKNSTQAVGTPYYMSPEQVLGNDIDCRSDIYSLGVTLFELATGVLPFVKGDLPYKHVHEPPPIPSSFNPQIDPTIETIILRMMKKNPDERFASCNEIISALKSVNYK